MMVDAVRSSADETAVDHSLSCVIVRIVRRECEGRVVSCVAE